MRSTLGIDAAFPGNFTGSSLKVNMDFQINGDITQPSDKYLAALLERKIPVLIYAGQLRFPFAHKSKLIT